MHDDDNLLTMILQLFILIPASAFVIMLIIGIFMF